MKEKFSFSAANDHVCSNKNIIINSSGNSKSSNYSCLAGRGKEGPQGAENNQIELNLHIFQ